MIVNSPASAATPTPTKVTEHRPLDRALLLVVLLLSLLLRLDGFRDDLWVDELHTAWVASAPWPELVERGAIGNQPPLYFAILKVITSIVGLSSVSLRMPSLLAGMALIVLGWSFAWRVTSDRWCALLAAIAIGLDSSCIYYSSEARAYALLQLCLAYFICLVCDDRPVRYQSVWRAMLAVIAVHLQFSALFFLTPLYLARAVMPGFGSWRDRWSKTSSLAIEIGLMLLLCAPLAFQITEIGERRDAWATFVPKPSWNGLANLFPWMPAALALAAYAIGLLCKRDQFTARKIPSLIGWLGCCALGPVALALILSLADIAPIFYRRYLLASLWPVLVIPAVAVAPIRGWPKWGMLLIVTGAIIFQSKFVAPDRWRAGRITIARREAWTAATKRISQIDPNGERPLFVVSGLIESRQLKNDPSPLLRNYCLIPVNTLYRVPQPQAEMTPASSIVPYEPPAEWLKRVKEKGGGIWLLRVGEEGAAAWGRFAERIILRLNNVSTAEDWQSNLMIFPGVAVLTVERKSNNSP